MKYIVFFLVIIAAGCLNGCLEDHTNLDYTKVILPDSVFVTNIKEGKRLEFTQDILNTTYRMKAGDELQLSAEVFYQGNEELTYEWRFEREIISTERDLKYVCTKTGDAMLLVYRKTADNATCYRFSILVQSPYTYGVAILAKDKNIGVLDFVERYTESRVMVDVGGEQTLLSTLHRFEEHPDIYPVGNGGAVMNVQEPLKLSSYSAVAPPWLKGIQILDKNWTTSVTVNSETMEKLTEMSDEFIGEPKSFRSKEFATVGVMNLLLSESGDIYTRVNYDGGSPCTGRYSSAPLTYNDPYDEPDKGPVTIKAEHIWELLATSYDPFVLIYEKENKRFLALSAVGSTGVFYGQNLDYSYVMSLPKLQVNKEILPIYTNLDAVDKELVAVFGPVNFGAEEMMFIFKDEANYYLQTNGFRVINYMLPHQIQCSAKNCVTVSAEVAGLLANASSHFEIYDKVIYFTSGNALYTMGIDGKDLQEIFRFPQKDKIKSFCRMTPWYSPAASVVNRMYNGKVFCASFENGDFKMVQIYDDPAIPGKPQYRFLVDKHYDGGIADILYFP